MLNAKQATKKAINPKHVNPSNTKSMSTFTKSVTTSFVTFWFLTLTPFSWTKVKTKEPLTLALSTIICYNCKEQGHYTFAYRKPKHKGKVKKIKNNQKSSRNKSA